MHLFLLNTGWWASPFHRSQTMFFLHFYLLFKGGCEISLQYHDLGLRTSSLVDWRFYQVVGSLRIKPMYPQKEWQVLMVTLRTVCRCGKEFIFGKYFTLTEQSQYWNFYVGVILLTLRYQFSRFCAGTFRLSISFNSASGENLSRWFDGSVSNWVSPGPRMMVPPPPLPFECSTFGWVRGKGIGIAPFTALACVSCPQANISRIRKKKKKWYDQYCDLSSFSILRIAGGGSSRRWLRCLILLLFHEVPISCSLPVYKRGCIGVSNRHKNFLRCQSGRSARKGCSSSTHSPSLRSGQEWWDYQYAFSFLFRW